jgi:hypothetical protein
LVILREAIFQNYTVGTIPFLIFQDYLHVPLLGVSSISIFPEREEGVLLSFFRKEKGSSTK